MLEALVVANGPLYERPALDRLLSESEARVNSGGHLEYPTSMSSARVLIAAGIAAARADVLSISTYHVSNC